MAFCGSRCKTKCGAGMEARIVSGFSRRISSKHRPFTNESAVDDFYHAG